MFYFIFFYFIILYFLLFYYKRNLKVTLTILTVLVSSKCKQNLDLFLVSVVNILAKMLDSPINLEIIEQISSTVSLVLFIIYSHIFIIIIILVYVIIYINSCLYLYNFYYYLNIMLLIIDCVFFSSS